MTFEDVRTYLLENLVPALEAAVQNKARTWIKSLEAEDESDLLGCCMAIDIASGSLTAGHLDAIFRDLAEPYDSARRAFAEAVERQHRDDVHRQSRYRGQEPSDEIVLVQREMENLKSL